MTQEETDNNIQYQDWKSVMAATEGKLPKLLSVKTKAR